MQSGKGNKKQNRNRKPDKNNTNTKHPHNKKPENHKRQKPFAAGETGETGGDVVRTGQVKQEVYEVFFARGTAVCALSTSQ